MAIFVLPFAIWSEGFVLAILWRWFAVPLGAPIVSTAQACGLAVIVGLATHQYIERDEEQTDKMAIVNALAPWIALFTGWVIRQFQ